MARKKKNKKSPRRSPRKSPPKKSPTLSPPTPPLEQVNLEAVRIAYDQVNRGDYLVYLQPSPTLDLNAYTLTFIPRKKPLPIETSRFSVVIIDDPENPTPAPAPRGGPITFIN